jgi:hypothetical protein
MSRDSQEFSALAYEHPTKDGDDMTLIASSNWWELGNPFGFEGNSFDLLDYLFFELQTAA